MSYVRKNHSLFIGEEAAENIKIKIGTACQEAYSAERWRYKDRNVITGLPKVVTLTSEEIRIALKDATNQIVDAVHGVLEKTPPELAADIVDRRNCAHRWRRIAPWNGHPDRAEDRRQHSDCAGCYVCGCGGNR